ncbi:MAG: N-acetyltransferase [Bacteroidales bacterium]|nr:N-acetyltransferase [Bacteroidales bacterium]
MNSKINHLKEQNRFETYVEGHVAFVEYIVRDGALIVVHTFVPRPLKGRGIASDLVKHAYDYADKEGLGCKATCSYALAWLEKHGY